MRIWIDLANTPHVLFFEPLIPALERRGHAVTVTLRHFAGTVPLAAARGLAAEPIGSGHDASRDEGRKQVEHQRREEQLVAYGRGRFDLVVNHGSYSQITAARRLGIPVVGALDYEHQGLGAFHDARRLMVPSVIPAAALAPWGIPARIVRHYEGLKEHVYLAGFRPCADVRARLEIGADQRLVVMRPIAHHAVYTDDSGDALQRRLVEQLAIQSGLCLLVLPRTPAQGDEYEALARRLPAIRVLRQVVDGPSLICAADLVVCGGGTMLREAAVLGVPALSIFSGRLGAVDHWLASEGRVALVRSDEDVARVRVERRPTHVAPPVSGAALAQVLQGIDDAAIA